MNHLNDTEFTDYIISSVEPSTKDPKAFTLGLADGSCIFVQNDKGLPQPAVGETARLFGRGFGYPVRGIVVGDQVYFYQTPDGFAQEAADEQRRRAEERRRDWDAKREEVAGRLAALPQAFQDRFQGFVDARPDFGPEFGPYELMVCEQAAALADKLGTPEAVSAFYEAPHEEQQRLFPELDGGHSGNSFGAMVALARLYLTDPELVPKQHGALCPLVGCWEYGCTPAR